jgi:hypothetical protein
MGELSTNEVTPVEKSSGELLDSWKEIAAYLNRDVTTVQRWEKREAMPVHRHVHDKRGSKRSQRLRPSLRRSQVRPLSKGLACGWLSLLFFASVCWLLLHGLCSGNAELLRLPPKSGRWPSYHCATCPGTLRKTTSLMA